MAGRRQVGDRVSTGRPALGQELAEEAFLSVRARYDSLTTVLDCRPATVRSHARRGLAALRQEIEP